MIERPLVDGLESAVGQESGGRGLPDRRPSRAKKPGIAQQAEQIRVSRIQTWNLTPAAFWLAGSAIVTAGGPSAVATAASSSTKMSDNRLETAWVSRRMRSSRVASIAGASPGGCDPWSAAP